MATIFKYDYMKKKEGIYVASNIKMICLVFFFLSLIILANSNLEAVPAGDEITVVPVANDYQGSPAIAMDSAGNFVVAWTSSIGVNKYATYAQRFTSNGDPIGNKFRIDTTVGAYFGTSPSIAMDDSGNFVIAWISSEPSYGVYARRYMSNGTAIDTVAEFKIASYLNMSFNNSIAMDNLGNFVITWGDYVASENVDIFALRFDLTSDLSHLNNDAYPKNKKFKVNTTTARMQYAPSIAMDNSGNFVIVWTSEHSNGWDGLWATNGIYARRYDLNGDSIGNDFKVSPPIIGYGYHNNPSVAMDNSGKFVVTWLNEDNKVDAWRYNSDGNPIDSAFSVNSIYTSGYQKYPSIAMDSTGNFVITWGSSSNGIRAQRFTSNGNKVGEAGFMVNTTINGDRNFPRIAMNNSGKFAIVWDNFRYENPTYYYGIYAKHYNPSVPVPVVLFLDML